MDRQKLEALVEHAFANEFNHTLHAYIDIADDLVAGTLLGQIMYWFSADKDGRRKVRIVKENEYWLAKKRDDWHAEIRISPKQYDRAIKILVDKGLVEVRRFKFNGDPTTHIRPIYENLAKAVREWKGERAQVIANANLPKREKPTDSRTEEGVNSNFTFGEVRTLQDSKNELYETVNSLTESTTKITTENTNKYIYSDSDESAMREQKKSAPNKSETEKGVLYEGQVYHTNTDKCNLVKDLFNSTCTSLPKVMKMNDRRKKSILARLNDYSVEEIKELFLKAERSDFLSGKKTDFKASFDWLLNESNALKVLEGNYDNTKGGNRNGQYTKHTEDPFADAHWNKVL